MALSKTHEVLKSIGAVFKRKKKHEIWELPNGKVLSCSSTPSDCRADENALRDLRRMMGPTDPERGKPGERREKKLKKQPRPPEFRSTPTINTAFADQLRVSGVVESQLRS